MNTILVATELSQKDEKLLNCAIHAASATGAELRIFHVLHTLRMPGMPDNSKENRDNCRAQIRDLVKEHPVGDRVKYKIHIAEGGHVYEQIDKCAQYVSADLVLMGVSEPKDNVPDLVLTTLERLLIEASYPILVVTQNFDNGYNNIAIHGHLEASKVEGLSMLAPLIQNKSITVHRFMDEAAQEAGFLARLWKKHRLRKDDKLLTDIKALLHDTRNEQVALIEHTNGSLRDLSKKIANNNIDVLALEPLSKNLFRGKPDPALREILYDPPCDLLIGGRG